MDRDRLLLGLAATFAGLTVVITVASLAVQPFLFVLAVPFAVLTYFLWYQATGRLEERTRRQTRARSASTGAGRTQTGRRPKHPDEDGPSRAEAYRRLGLEPGADDATVKRAYREQVKEVHPDTADGDQEEFKRVTRAYERLTGADTQRP